MNAGSPEKIPVIYMADDDDNNLFIMKATLKPEGYKMYLFKSAVELLEFLDRGEDPADLVLLDIMMPVMDGMEAAAKIKGNPKHRRLPVIMVTGLDGVEHKVCGLDTGADEYITKPFHPMEVRARVRALLRLKFLGDQVEQKNLLLSDEKLHLESLVQERTKELEDITIGVVSALEKANEFNDTDTGKHILRVCAYSEMLASAMNLPGQAVLKITRYASLHDVGKVAVPDELLKRPGPLTAAEFEEMKRHTVMGWELLALARSDQIAKNISLCHHEKFNGKGYPLGLKGREIPLEARIVALADVFDALTTRRCYKNAYPLELARQIIAEERGKHLDPSVVDTFLARWDDVAAILERYKDTAAVPISGGTTQLPTRPDSPLSAVDPTSPEQG